MANRNTIADVINRQNNGVPLSLSATTTLHAAFQLANGSAAILNIPNPMVPIDCAAPFPNLSPDGRPFLVRLSGKVTGGEKYQVDLVLGHNVLTPVVASTGLSPNGLTADNWLIEAELMFDSVSGFLRGFQYGWAGAVANAGSGLSQASSLSAVTLATLLFTAVATIPSANANAVITVTEFEAELL